MNPEETNYPFSSFEEATLRFIRQETLGSRQVPATEPEAEPPKEENQEDQTHPPAG